MPEYVDSTTYLFADDTKIFREIKSPNDEEKLQNDLDELHKWSDTWLLKFHPNKCKVLTIEKWLKKRQNNITCMTRKSNWNSQMEKKT